MQSHNGHQQQQQQPEATAPPSASLSVGFWDAFAAGCMWTEPVLAALSFSPLGKDHILVLATDGSTAVENGENNNDASGTSNGSQPQQQQQQPQQQQQQQQQQAAVGGEQKKEGNGLCYQYGRLLMRRETIPCKPEFLINKYLALVVYSKCPLKGRLTPVVTDLQLLPGQWSRPSGPLVLQPHALYATQSSGGGPQVGAPPEKSRGKEKNAPAAENELPSAAGGKRLKTNAGGNVEDKDKTVYARSRSGPVATVRRGVRTAIGDLHLYSHDWELLARISYKSDVKTFANAKGESILFTVHLIDAQATEIRATFFGRAAAHWHGRLHVGRVYCFSKGTLQRANRMHNSLPHEVQIKFDTAAEIEERDDDPSIPLQKFDRVQLRDLQNLSAGCVVDILAFVVEAKELETVLSKAKNEQLMRRELTLLDASGSFVSFTLFGAQALQLPQSALENQPLIAIKGAKVQEYGGRACLLSSAQMQITFLQRPSPAEANRSIQKEAETEAEAETNTKGKTETEAKAKCSSPPQLPGAAGIAAADVEEEFAWFDSKGLDMLCSLQNKGVKAKRPLTLAAVEREAEQLQAEAVGSSRAFSVRGSVLDLQGSQLFWIACPQCKRKLQKTAADNLPAGHFSCSSCRKAVKAEMRWKLPLKLIDSWGTLNCVALGKQGQEIMKVVGVTAEGLKKLEAGGRDTRGRTFTDILQQLIFAEFRFDLVAKCEVYKDNKTVQILVRAASDETEDPWAKVQDSVRLTERILSSQFAICQQH